MSKALGHGPCVTRGSHSFTCYLHTNNICLYSPAARRHRPLVGTHCAYPRRDGQAELSGVAACIVQRYMSGSGNWTRTRSPST